MRKILLSVLFFTLGFLSIAALVHTFAGTAHAAKACSCNDHCNGLAPNNVCSIHVGCNIKPEHRNGTCGHCPNPGTTESCGSGMICRRVGDQNVCVANTAAPPTAPPPTAAPVTSGSDAGGSDSSDPTPARIGVEDCAVNGKANAGVKTELGICIPKDPNGFTAAYYSVGLGLIGGLSALFIIFGGYLILTSGGNPDRLNNGKSFLFYAIFGLLLAIFGYVFIQVIAVDILHLPGFTKT